MSLSGKQRTRPRISSLFVGVLPKNSALARSSESVRSTVSLDLFSNESDDDSEHDASDPCISTIPHEGFAKNEEWVGAQKSILSIFQGNKMSPGERSALYKLVRRLTHSELGPFIYDYYRNQLMPRGMRIMRQEILSNSEGHMKGLEVMWNAFYKEMLSDLKVALHPVASVRISNPPSENYLRLERLVGRVIVPYLGYLGLYEGNSEPRIQSQNYQTVLQRAKNVTDEISLTRAPSLYQKKRPRMKSAKFLTLETVREMTQREHQQLLAAVDARRYSCDILMR